MTNMPQSVPTRNVQTDKHLGYVWEPHLRLRLRFSVFFLLLLSSHICETCGYCSCTVHEQ